MKKKIPLSPSNLLSFCLSANWVDGDYHLKSNGWRWNVTDEQWAHDTVTSRCIDASNPGSSLADDPLTVPDDPCNIFGVNRRINMGAYGGTSEASIPPPNWALLADLTNDGIVNLEDYSPFTKDASNIDHPGDLNRDGVRDLLDLALLAADWLEQTVWHY